MESKLIVKDLECCYDGKCILNKLSFEVKAGEFLSILGPSGCGKTTLLRTLIGLVQPSGGSIIKDGEDITVVPSSVRNMGIVFQDYALFENMTVIQNVEYALRIKKENRSAAAREELRNKVLETLKGMGILEYRDQYPHQLSGGQKQRVALARTLIMNPDIILFDEPMAALDINTRTALKNEIKSLQKKYGTTMIYVTHDQEEAVTMSDRVMVMREAEIVQIDSPENILFHPADEYVEEFVVRNLRSKAEVLNEYMGKIYD